MTLATAGADLHGLFFCLATFVLACAVFEQLHTVVLAWLRVGVSVD